MFERGPYGVQAVGLEGDGMRGEGLEGRRVLIVGAGNIGSHLAPLVARTGVRLIRVVDRDRVEEKNLANQAFRRADVGRPKAEVLAEHTQGQCPGSVIEARVADLQELPLGLFDVDLVFGALDSRRARQLLVSDSAWPLGVPVVDGGVGEGLVGRVQVFVPGETMACLECGWGGADYRQLAEEYPCDPAATYRAPATVSPAFAGAVVAGIMAAEGLRLLAGEPAPESREIAFDLFHRRFLVSRLRRAPRCRFDHAVVRERLRLGGDPDTATVGDLLDAVGRRFGSAPVQLEFRRLPGQGGFDAERFITPERLRAREGEPLAAFGLQPGDYLRVRSGSESAFVVLDGEKADSTRVGTMT
jgi:sulfur-carrier protein adenylyltransferase/sulfurtransferase